MNTTILVTLKAMLGTETGNTWISFMQTVEDELPILSKAGAPTKMQIRESAIGKAGFSSWKAMVENGLEWNMNSWKAWRRAWSKVKEFPYLRTLDLTASEINTITKLTDNFPLNLDELEKFRSSKKSIADEKRQNSILALQSQIVKLEVKISVLETSKAVVLSELAIFKENAKNQDSALATTNKTIGKLEAHSKKQTQALSKANDIINYHKSMNLWQRLRWVFKA
jgi:hypothetical protein